MFHVSNIYLHENPPIAAIHVAVNIPVPLCAFAMTVFQALRKSWVSFWPSWREVFVVSKVFQRRCGCLGGIWRVVSFLFWGGDGRRGCRFTCLPTLAFQSSKLRPKYYAKEVIGPMYGIFTHMNG